MVDNALKRSLCGVVIGLAAAAGLPAGAAEPQPAAETQVAAQEVRPISVTATRNPLDAFDYPGMVSVIGRDEIERDQPSSLDDLLRDVPGTTFSGGPRRTGEVPSIRGFSGPDVILLLDGARQNFISGHDGRIFIDPFFLRGAEVVRGASSALYGSGGTGGVMEFRTLQARDLIEPGKNGGYLLGGGYQAVNQEWHTGIAGATRAGRNASVLGGVVLRRSQDIELGDGSTLNSEDNIVSGLVKGTLTHNRSNTSEISWSLFNNDAVEPNNGQTADATDIVDKEIQSNTIRLAHRYNPASPLWDLDILFYHVRTEERETRLDGNGAGPVGEVLDQSLYTTGLRVDNRSRAGLGQDILGILTYGVEAYWDKGEGRTDGAPRDGVPDAKNRFLAAYVQGQIEFEKLPGGMSATILPGLRFDSYSSESSGSPENSDQEVSPKIAVQLRPVKPLTLLGSYAKAFRAPTIGELFPTGTHFVIPGFGTNSFVPNPDLKPQTTDTWEAGASLQFRDLVDSGDRFQVKGVHYWVKGKDFIDIVVFQPGPPACFPPACDGTTMSENVANARLDGYEIEARYESSRYLFSASFAHIDGEDEDTGAPLGVLTPDTLNLHAAVKLPEHDVRVGWRFIHANDFTNTDDPALERDSYNVHNAYLTWQAPRTGSFPGLGLSLGVDNIFDEAYARSASDAFEPGRNFKMTLFYRKSL